MDFKNFKLWKFIGLCSGISYPLAIIFNRIASINHPEFMTGSETGAPITFLIMGLIVTAFVAAFESDK